MSDSIRDLGQKVLELENVFSLMERFEGKELETRAILGRVPEYCRDFDKLKEEKGVRAPLPESLIRSENYPSFLALSLIDHDFRNLAQPLEPIERLIKPIKPELFLVYENLRIGLALIPYIATGDPRFLVSINTDRVAQLLEVMVGKLNCSYDFNGFQTISSDHYFAVCELVRNAKDTVKRAKESSVNPENINDKIVVTFKQEYSNLVIIVKDNGTGIPEDKLGKIFGVYTDKEDGTGIGLQVVKRIVDLKGGYADVISTVQGKPAFKYDTKFGNTQKAGQPLDPKLSGTYFILYFPKSQ